MYEEFKVKVFPLELIMKHVQRQGGNKQNADEMFNLISESHNCFQEEKLQSLAGLISPLSSYLQIDNFFVIGLFNIVCIKDLNRVDSKNSSQWKFFKKDPEVVYSVKDSDKDVLFEVISQMDADLMYLYTIPDQFMVAKFQDGYPLYINFDPVTSEITALTP